MSEAPATPNFDPMNPDMVRDAFLEEIAEAADRAKEIEEGFARAPAEVTDDKIESAMTTLAQQCGKCAAVIEGKRKEAKGRYDACGNAIHGVAKKHVDTMTDIKKKIEARINTYQRQKIEAERRRQLEEAERLCKEAEDQAAHAKTLEDIDAAIAKEDGANKAAQSAGAKPSKLHQARGEYGGLASSQKVLAFEITDLHAIPLSELRLFFDSEAITKALRAFLRLNKETVQRAIDEGEGGKLLAGVRFYEDLKTVVR